MSQITILGLGTCGDLQPLGALARALREREHDVQFLTIPDYKDLVTPYGVPFVPIGPSLVETIAGPDFRRLITGKFDLRAAWRCAQILRHVAIEIMEDLWRKVPRTDIVIYNPIAQFGAELARDLGAPSMRVMCQPLLPSWRQSCALFTSGRSLGGPLNRISYELTRGITAACRINVPIAGKVRVPLGSNPLSRALRDSHQILAASPSLCADPGDWPVPVEIVGFWYQEPPPQERLPQAVETFLEAGPPPIYVGFGSMNWGAPAITGKVVAALRLWGGRAVLGAGGFVEGTQWPENVLAGGIISHKLLFPRVAGVVHHGGAGTTAAGLRFGRPTQILPVMADQVYWGRQVEANGAGPRPIGLHKVSIEELARRFAAISENSVWRDGAGRIARAMAGDPGLQAGVSAVERILAART